MASQSKPKSKPKSKSQSQSQSSSPEGTLRPGLRTAILLLSLTATAVAGYLAWISFTGSDAVGCGPDSGCAAVLNSRWAYWMGLPVSALGGIVYVAILVGAFLLTGRAPAERQRRIWRFLLLSAWLVVGAAIWFVLLQTVVIHQFCPFCMTAHGAALIAAVLLLRHCPYGLEPTKAKERDHRVYVTPASVKNLVYPALAGLALLAAGQWVAPKKTFVETKGSGGVQITTNASASSNPAPNDLAAAATTSSSEAPPDGTPAASTAATAPSNTGEFRSISLFDGKLQFDLADVPIIGRADAPHIMIGLHDYTCHGCRSMHQPLMEVFRKYSNQLAIVSLPLPLDADCNPLVPRTPPAHVNACQYAKISLAVWRAKPDAVPEFDDWVFAPEHPPSVDETRRFAQNLVGEQAFAEAWNDPLVDRQLKINIALYGLNYQVNKRSSMPQLFMGNSVLFGSMSKEELEKKVVEEFGLTAKP